MRPNDWRAELSSIEESEARRRDFGPIRWRLLKLANVDYRDVVAHSDRVAYSFIGGVLILFGLYALLGWSQLAAQMGAGKAGPILGPIIQAALAIGATLAIVGFDRFLIGRTQVKLDVVVPLSPEYEAAVPITPGSPAAASNPTPTATSEPSQESGLEDVPFGPEPEPAANDPEPADLDEEPAEAVDDEFSEQDVAVASESAAAEGQIRADALERSNAFEIEYLKQTRELSNGARIPQLVKVGWGFGVGAVFRVALAILIALFVTNSVKPVFFDGAIESQRFKLAGDRVQAQIKENQKVYDDAVKAYDKEVVLQTKTHDDAYDKWKSQARALAKGQCREVADRETPCGRSRTLALAAQKALDGLETTNPNMHSSAAYKTWDKKRTHLIEVRDALTQQKAWALKASAPPPGSAGALEPEELLDSYLADNPSAKDKVHMLLALLLVLDLAAIIAKLACHNTEYEQRQAMRRWLEWTAVRLGEGHRLAAARREATRADARLALADALESEGQLTELRRARATERALRDAFDDDLKVHNEAERAAYWDLVSRLRQYLKRAQADAGAADDAVTDPQPRAPTDPHVLPDTFVGIETWTRLEAADPSGHSMVWKARNRKGELAALKVVEMKTDVQVQRASTELDWLSKRIPHLHNNIVQLVDQGKLDHRRHWYATRWGSEGTLRAYYSTDHRPIRPIGGVWAFGQQIVDGLSAAADAVHNDLKPDNLFLYPNEAGGYYDGPQLRIGDWGLATGDGADMNSAIPDAGTLLFAAPDLIERPPAGKFASTDDIFALGAVLYWAISGAAPGQAELEQQGFHPRDDGYREALLRVRKNLPPLHVTNPAIPEFVGEFIAQLLDPKRERRLLTVPDHRGALYGQLRNEMNEVRRQLEDYGLLDLAVGPFASHEPRVNARRERRTAHPPASGLPDLAMPLDPKGSRPANSYRDGAIPTGDPADGSFATGDPSGSASGGTPYDRDPADRIPTTGEPLSPMTGPFSWEQLPDDAPEPGLPGVGGGPDEPAGPGGRRRPRWPRWPGWPTGSRRRSGR